MKKVTIEEFERCEMNVTEANSYGVYPPTLGVVVADKRRCRLPFLSQGLPKDTASVMTLVLWSLSKEVEDIHAYWTPNSRTVPLE